MKLFYLLIITILFVSCYDEDFVAKKRGYYHVQMPEKKYVSFNETDYPYSFDYPVYGKPVKDTVFFDKHPENPYWMNIEIPSLGGKIFLTYKEINAKNKLEVMINDAYKMSYAHDKKASYINNPVFNTVNNVHGVLYEVGGNAASALQFYATDSVHHFLRGALYFDVAPNVDSLAPANEFLRKDVEQLIQSLKWNK
jgi:gliding motility-associated lipoprotein GldD